MSLQESPTLPIALALRPMLMTKLINQIRGSLKQRGQLMLDTLRVLSNNDYLMLPESNTSLALIYSNNSKRDLFHLQALDRYG